MCVSHVAQLALRMLTSLLFSPVLSSFPLSSGRSAGVLAQIPAEKPVSDCTCVPGTAQIYSCLPCLQVGEHCDGVGVRGGGGVRGEEGGERGGVGGEAGLRE